MHEYEVIGVVKNGNVLQSMLGNVIPAFVYIPYTTFQNQVRAILTKLQLSYMIQM